VNNVLSSKRPIIEVASFNQALASSSLTKEEESIIEYIRYTGVFDELKIRKELSLPPSRRRYGY
jgi:hypothetical protein